MRVSRKAANWASIIALVLCVGLSWVPRFRGPIDVRYDAGVYLLTGLSLASGSGYSLIHEPGSPQAVQYPPGLPALVSLVSLATASSDPAEIAYYMRFVYFGLHIIFIILVYALALRFVRPLFAFGAALILATCPLMIFFSDLLHAELPFALLATAYLYLSGLKREGRTNWIEVPIAILGMLTLSLRLAGVALPLARTASSLLRRDWIALVATVVTTVAVLGMWQTYVKGVQGSEKYNHPAYEYQRAAYNFYNVSYSDNIRYRDPFKPELGMAELPDYVERVGQNIKAFLLDAPSGFLATPKTVVAGLNFRGVESENVTSLAFGAAVAIGLLIWPGLVLLWRRGETLIPLSVLLSLALISITPWPGQVGRYLLPLGGVFAISMVVVLQWLSERGRPSLRRYSFPAIVIVFLGLPLLFNAVGSAFFYNFLRPAQAEPLYPVRARLFSFENNWAGFNQAHSWLRSNSQPDDIVASSSPQWTYILTRRHAVMPPFENDPAESQRLLDGVPVAFLIVDTFKFIDVAQRYAEKAVLAHPDRWEKAYVSDDGTATVYRRNK